MESATAALEVTRNGNLVATMYPAKLFYKKPQQPATHVAIRSTPLYDLYVVLAGIDDQSGMATFQVFLTPLVFWLWAGGLVMVIRYRDHDVAQRARARRDCRGAQPGQAKQIGAEPAPGGE